MEILELLTQPKRLSQLRKLTHMPKENLDFHLKLLIKENKIAKGYDKKYYLLKEGTYIDSNPNYGFIKPDLGDKDVFCLKDYSKKARNNDKVLYYEYKDSYSNRQASQIVKIVERYIPIIIGTIDERIYNGRRSLYLVQNNLERSYYDIINYPSNLLPGMVVKAKVNFNYSYDTCEYIETIGNIDDPGIEISMIASEYGFYTEFPLDVKEEVKTIAQELLESDYIGRVDYRNLSAITIDGDDSKDFDDAVYLEKDNEGNYLLYVFIADVSSYVTYNSPLDQEAYKRGTSVYLADRVIPMLPHELSNGICSLNEKVDRKVLTCMMKIDHKGKFLNYDLKEGIIKSRHRMTYNKVNLMLEGDKDTIDNYRDIYDMILQMNELHNILRSKREHMGGLEFEIDEYKFSLNPDGSPKDITVRVRKEAEKIIEDFMICANEAVAKYLSGLNLPCLYRVHDKPDEDKLRDVFNTLSNMGVEVKVPRNDIKPKIIQQALDKISDGDDSLILNNRLLRAMAKAKYQPENIGHYGLALDYYCHFTSPIRRYPDLIVHRIIKELVLHKNDKFRDYFRYYDSNLEEIGISASNSERKAIECERAVNDMLQAWYAESMVDGIYKGIITSVTNFGFFVTLANGVEGLVHERNLPNTYRLDEKTKAFVNYVTHNTYKLGDHIDVIVKAADRVSKRIDFIPVVEVKK